MIKENIKLEFVKEIHIEKDKQFNIKDFKKPTCSKEVDLKVFKDMKEAYQPELDKSLDGFQYLLGNPKVEKREIEDQGYRISIGEDGISIRAEDSLGFLYAIDTFKSILAKSGDKSLSSMKIYDYPTLKKRGLMLDISRGKVYTLEYLLNLMDILRALRINVFQLYIEHTFDFKTHPEISKGTSPITAKEIGVLQEKCKENGIELQANLQSLGHMNHILTREEYMDLSESDMYWSLDTTSERTYELLDDMYGEFLPLFESKWLNVCSDEPYDLGKGKSASTGKSVGELYFNHLKKLHDLAAKYGKKIMLFGDVVKDHPEYAAKMPEDIIYIDWIYDPKKHYGSPELFKETGIPYWVSPGTGNWNTLFPRLDGSITNIVNLTLEGIKEGAQGMLVTDWNDHGGYTQPGPAYYSYAYGALVSWAGEDPGEDKVDGLIDRVLNLPGYSKVIHKLAKIYQVSPMWSKNRSQCVMALFDEPIFGKAVRGQEPPKDLKAYDLELPEGLEPVFERHSQHPLRPYFSIPESSKEEIREILKEVKAPIEALKDGFIKDQFLYIFDAFKLMVDKLDLSKKIISLMSEKELEIKDFILLEDELRLMIKRYVRLQTDFTRLWFDIGKHSEIEISLIYFANIISRLDYLRDWLSIQREEYNKSGVDWDFKTYNTGDYETLPTY